MIAELSALRPPDVRDLYREVHVWTAATGDYPVGLFESWMSADETRRYHRYIRQEDRDLFLLAHALLRHTLSEYADVEPADWCFEIGQDGRPELIGPVTNLDMRFNISHTPGLAAVLISDGADAGVDVERRCGVDDRPALARTVFADAELAALGGLTAEEFDKRFYEFWTLKESYIKARGLGLKLPLRKFAFSVDGERGIEIEFEEPICDDSTQWQFALWRPGTEHQGAVALRRGAKQNRRIVFRKGLAAVRTGDA